MINFLSWVAVIALSVWLWQLYGLLRNYLVARKTGFPLIIIPYNPKNLVFIIFAGLLKPIFKQYLPESLYDRLNLTIYGFGFEEKYRTHAKLGASYMLVTPVKNEIWTADPQLSLKILQRRQEFPQFEVTAVLIGIFGGNLLSVSIL